MPAPGGEKIDPNPADLSKQGSKRHLVVDKGGVPLAVRHTAANIHDSKMLEELGDAIKPIRRPRGQARKRSEKLHAYKAYDAQSCHQVMRRGGIKGRIARKGKESSERLGRHHWVERTLAQLARYRRLEVALGERCRHLPGVPRAGVRADLLELCTTCLSGMVLKSA